MAKKTEADSLFLYGKQILDVVCAQLKEKGLKIPSKEKKTLLCKIEKMAGAKTKPAEYSETVYTEIYQTVNILKTKKK